MPIGGDQLEDCTAVLGSYLIFPSFYRSKNTNTFLCMSQWKIKFYKAAITYTFNLYDVQMNLKASRKAYNCIIHTLLCLTTTLL